jgi:hypothetical protein
MSILLAPPPITARPRRPAFTESATSRGARASIAVQAGSVSTVPMRLLRRWAAARHECVVIDLDGRYSELDLPAPGRIVDVADLSADELCEVVRARRRVSVLGFSHVTAESRSNAVGMALAAVTAQRAKTGRPRWLMIDDAETVLSDPDIPPHALDLSQRGYCLILRSSERLPNSLAATIYVVLPDRDLSGGDWGPLPGHRDHTTTRYGTINGSPQGLAVHSSIRTLEPPPRAKGTRHDADESTTEREARRRSLR